MEALGFEVSETTKKHLKNSSKQWFCFDASKNIALMVIFHTAFVEVFKARFPCSSPLGVFYPQSSEVWSSQVGLV